MTTLTLQSGSTIRYYTDIDEFPAGRRSFLTRYLLEAAELDVTPAAMADRIGQIMTAYRSDRPEDGETGLQNLYLSLQLAAERYEPDGLALGVLLHDVDGVPVTDLSPGGLQPVVERIRITAGECERIVADVKKNSPNPETAISLGLAKTT